VMYALGRCDEGLARTRELMDQSPMDQVPVYAGLHSALASGYLCEGRLDQALKEIDTTLKTEYSAGRMFTRAVILYDLGRFSEALDQLDKVYELEPTGNGFRRYLEALIRLEMGDRDAALGALEEGTWNTWKQYGLYSYVQGQDALANGDRQEAIELISLAQATLLRDYGPLLPRMERELSALGATPAVVTPSLLLSITPLPTLTPTVTPRAPLPSASILEPMIMVDGAKGTGPRVFRTDDHQRFRFQFPEAIEGEVLVVTIYLIPLEPDPSVRPELRLMLPNPQGLWVPQSDPLAWDANEILSPSELVTDAGAITIGTRNSTDRDVFVDNLAVSALVRLPSGTVIMYGWSPP